MSIKLKKFGLFGPKKVKWGEFSKKLREQAKQAAEAADYEFIHLSWTKNPDDEGKYNLRVLISGGDIDKAYAEGIIDESSIYYFVSNSKDKVTDDTEIPENVQKAMLEAVTEKKIKEYVKKLLDWNRKSGNRTTPKYN